VKPALSSWTFATHPGAYGVSGNARSDGSGEYGEMIVRAESASSGCSAANAAAPRSPLCSAFVMPRSSWQAST